MLDLSGRPTGHSPKLFSTRLRLPMGAPRLLALPLLGLVVTSLIVAPGCRSEQAGGEAKPTEKSATQEPPESESEGEGGHAAETGDATEKHVNAGGNRLAGETSPYLLQHAHNPVDWRPWGDAALAAAKAENKLIFLSIGYSSCHWCHVMERESFVDKEVAEFLNEHFICIKVDREERPDVDDVYMTALQVYLASVGGGSGGWPLSMFLTPEAKPTVGGTYMPRDQFLQAAQSIHKTWRESPEQLTRIGDAVAERVQLILNEPPGGQAADLDAATASDAVFAAINEQHDPQFAGFGFSPVNDRMPKFPEPSNLAFLFDRATRRNDSQAENVALAAMRAIVAGGIRDHVGGGFHRYSTDRYWTVPHFEKMLYDNAQLVGLLADAYERTGDDAFRVAASEAIEFLARELRDEQGGFYAALDADSGGVEGSYYVYSPEELKALLTEEEYAAFTKHYAPEATPNFEREWIIPRRAWTASELASPEIPETDAPLLASAKAKLLAVRDERTPPGVDGKVLAAWNGLAIRGLADAGRTFDDETALAYARSAAEFCLDKLRDDQGRLFRTYTAGEAQLAGYLDDYAFLVDGLIALHEATGEARWLEASAELTDAQIELFADAEAGGFFYTAADQQQLIVRGKKPHDGPLPASAAISVENLLYLARELDRPELAATAEATLNSLAPRLRDVPAAMPRTAVALEAWAAAEATAAGE